MLEFEDANDAISQVSDQVAYDVNSNAPEIQKECEESTPDVFDTQHDESEWDPKDSKSIECVQDDAQVGRYESNGEGIITIKHITYMYHILLILQSYERAPCHYTIL